MLYLYNVAEELWYDKKVSLRNCTFTRTGDVYVHVQCDLANDLSYSTQTPYLLNTAVPGIDRVRIPPWRLRLLLGLIWTCNPNRSVLPWKQKESMTYMYADLVIFEEGACLETTFVLIRFGKGCNPKYFKKWLFMPFFLPQWGMLLPSILIQQSIVWIYRYYQWLTSFN